MAPNTRVRVHSAGSNTRLTFHLDIKNNRNTHVNVFYRGNVLEIRGSQWSNQHPSVITDDSYDQEASVPLDNEWRYTFEVAVLHPDLVNWQERYAEAFNRRTEFQEWT